MARGKVIYSIFVDFVIESKEDTEANMCKENMRRFGENVIEMKGVIRPIRCQVLLDREMRELNDLTAFPIDNRDET